MGTEYCICPPKLTSLNGEGTTMVTHSSSWQHRKAVENIVSYFRGEMSCPLIKFNAKDKPTDKNYIPYEAYLFHKDKFNLLHEFKATEVVCLGSCLFYKKDNMPWVLEWVWIHPYFRRKGVLKEAWPIFTERYGDFEIEKTLSIEMEAFIKKMYTS